MNDISESTRDCMAKMARLKAYMESLKTEPPRSLLQDKIDQLEHQIAVKKRQHLKLVVSND